jgi:hypothetical protein
MGSAAPRYEGGGGVAHHLALEPVLVVCRAVVQRALALAEPRFEGARHPLHLRPRAVTQLPSPLYIPLGIIHTNKQGGGHGNDLNTGGHGVDLRLLPRHRRRRRLRRRRGVDGAPRRALALASAARLAPVSATTRTAHTAVIVTAGGTGRDANLPISSRCRRSSTSSSCRAACRVRSRRRLRHSGTEHSGTEHLEPGSAAVSSQAYVHIVHCGTFVGSLRLVCGKGSAPAARRPPAASPRPPPSPPRSPGGAA